MKVPFGFVVLAMAQFTLWAFPVMAHPGSGIFVDAKGYVYFTDTGEGVWVIDTKRVLTLFSKSALHWMVGDEEGRFAHAPGNFGNFERITPTGSKPAIVLCSDFPCALGTDGNLYYADTRGPARIIRRKPDGTESVLASGSDSSAGFRRITGMAAGGDDSIYIVELDREGANHAIIKVSMNGVASTFSSGFLNTLENRLTTRGNECRGLALHPNGTVFVAACDRRCVVKITPQGEVSIVLEATAPWFPTGVTVVRDEVYVLEYSDMPLGWNPDDRKGWVPRVRKVDRRGNAASVATVPRQDIILQAK